MLWSSISRDFGTLRSVQPSTTPEPESSSVNIPQSYVQKSETDNIKALSMEHRVPTINDLRVRWYMWQEPYSSVTIIHPGQTMLYLQRRGSIRRRYLL